jgi:glycosyltransferase involved in cell wall biosynthesis
MKKQKICFVALQAYPVLSKSDYELVGGAEVQQVLLANELKNKGFDISFIEADYGQHKLEEIEGIKVFKGVVRFIPFTISLLWALCKVNADIYYQRSAGAITGIVALFCMIKKRKFIYSISHQSNVDGTHIKDTYLRHKPFIIRFLYKRIYKFGIRNADCIIAQNEDQKELLKKTFKKEGVIIKSGLFLVDGRQKKSMPPIVLWISTVKDWKQPEIFLELAKTISTTKFQMVGGSYHRDKEFYEDIKRSASKIPNLDFVGFVPYHEINQYFDRASIFVNTSTAEGFPNTFLQAWLRYTPVVSLNVDPDEIICKYKLGFHSRTFERMVEDVKILLKDEQLREERGINGREYVERVHDIHNIVEDYRKLLEKLAREN